MYIADLHIHSRFSRATSKDGNPENLDLWARRKGIHIVGTGDFTHPEWRRELEEKLEPAEDGLYRLKEEYRIKDPSVPDDMVPRFVVTGEISSIYKKDGRVRKVHSLILLPGLEEAGLLSGRLEAIGNLHSDGRPILGLSCRDLLEITQETCRDSMFVPAHIWTPHFALFGAFSGFDSMEECFDDMTPYVHAVETGLSSDPPMNWQLSALDSLQLISNSDAHSPGKLGREANLLEISMGYHGLYEAIQKGNGLSGTIEFFPEEGKYHFDGHRKCHVCLSPQEADRYGGICPVCGKRMTTGVSHRIGQLADRPEGTVPRNARHFESLVPLPEVIAASTGHSAASGKVEAEYGKMVKNLGAEFCILREVPLEDIKNVSGSRIAEGIRRLREGRVERIPGYDGEYGVIRLFRQDELDSPEGQLCLFTGEELRAMKEASVSEKKERTEEKQGESDSGPGADGKTGTQKSRTTGKAVPEPENALMAADGLNERQQEAVTAEARAIAVSAGPGTGKTRTLISRILYLLKERGISPAEITAVTFTKKAAGEMRERLEKELGGKRAAAKIRIGTFHAIAFQLLKKADPGFQLADDGTVRAAASDIISRFGLKLSAGELLRRISLRKTGDAGMAGKEELPSGAYERYQEILREKGMLDFDDLLLGALALAGQEGGKAFPEKSFSFLLVDEFQDISPLEFQLIMGWNRNGKELFVIGDPDQSIYSFRGADALCFERLAEEFPDLKRISLEENYRSCGPVIAGALGVIEKNGGGKRTLRPKTENGRKIRIVTAPGELAENIFIAREISRMTGGMDMLEAQKGMENGGERKLRGFSDVAVLFRTRRQGILLEDCLKKEGIPYVSSGRGEFLSDPQVQGTISFFRYVLDRTAEEAGRQAGSLLWNLSGDCLGEAVLSAMAEKYKEMTGRGKPAKILDRWMEEMGMKGKKPMEMLRSAALFHKTMADFLDTLEFGEEGDLKRCGGKTYEADAVTLMTLHGSKGLEFPVVFLCGAERDLLPLKNAQGDAEEEEERRLLYVGMTRAEEELILTAAGEESPFLSDIPEEVSVREQTGKRRVRQEAEQMSFSDFMDMG